MGAIAQVFYLCNQHVLAFVLVRSDMKSERRPRRAPGPYKLWMLNGYKVCMTERANFISLEFSKLNVGPSGLLHIVNHLNHLYMKHKDLGPLLYLYPTNS